MTHEPATAGDSGADGLRLSKSDPMARALTEAVHAGDLDSLHRLLAEHPGLAAAWTVDEQGRSGTALHAATDWPGYFPNGPAIVAALIAAGADPSAPVEGSWHSETPLHWAASSDDLEVAIALIDGGANIEATGASITGGTPLDDAVGYGCWHVARLLVERGARVDDLWKAAALGLMARVEELMAAEPPPSSEELDHAFWQACHGGQRRMADYLLARGANINAIPDHSKNTPLEVAPGPDTRRDAVVSWLRDHGAKTAQELSSG